MNPAMRPAFSVMTPVYDGEDFVDRCYFMLASQTVADWEWVIVNDGSTDTTEARIKSINDPRIKLITYKQNQGRGYARNQALKAARGDWLVVWDVDDIYFPDRLEKANEARLAGYEFCCSYVVVIDNDLRCTGMRGFTQDDSGTTRLFAHPSLSLRLDLAREIGYDGSWIGEDPRLIFHLSRTCTGQWLKDAVTAYQEVREVNIRKAITSKRGRRAAYQRLYNEGIFDLGPAAYARLMLKLNLKLALLNLFRIVPPLYRGTVRFRSTGAIDDGWQLPDERKAFLEEVQERHQQNDWSLTQRSGSIGDEVRREGRKLLKVQKKAGRENHLQRSK